MRWLKILALIFAGLINDCMAAHISQVQAAFNSSLSKAMQGRALAIEEQQKLQAIANCLFFKQDCDEAYRRDLVAHEADQFSPDFIEARKDLLEQYQVALEQGLVVAVPALISPSDDSTLVKELILAFNLDEHDQNLLRRLIRWVYYQVHDEVAEQLYFKVLKCRRQQANLEKGFVVSFYNAITDQYEQEEHCVLNSPLQQAADRWLQNWEAGAEDIARQREWRKLQDLQKRLQTLKGDSGLQSDEKEGLIWQDLRNRLAALKGATALTADTIITADSSVSTDSDSAATSSPIEQAVLVINLSDNVVKLEQSLKHFKFSYQQLINLDVSAKQVYLENLKLALTQDLSNLVTVEYFLITLLGKTYREVLQDMNFDVKKKLLSDWLQFTSAAYLPGASRGL